MRPFSLRKSAIFLTTALMTACLATTAYATEPAPAFNDVPQDSQSCNINLSLLKSLKPFCHNAFIVFLV